MSRITREQVIKYLDGVGYTVDWDYSDPRDPGAHPWTLEEIRAEVIADDTSNGEHTWPDILDYYEVGDIEGRQITRRSQTTA